MRGKLAIAITANFVNNKTSAEERVPEIRYGREGEGFFSFLFRWEYFSNQIKRYFKINRKVPEIDQGRRSTGQTTFNSF